MVLILLSIKKKVISCVRVDLFSGLQLYYDEFRASNFYEVSRSEIVLLEWNLN